MRRRAINFTELVHLDNIDARARMLDKPAIASDVEVGVVILFEFDDVRGYASPNDARFSSSRVVQ